jgi:hypothetical protein
MTADPIQAAKERLNLDQAIEIVTRRAVVVEHSAAAFRTSRERYGYGADAKTQWHREQGDDLERQAVANDIEAAAYRMVLGALADARRQIAERDEALKSLADEIEHEGLRIGIRSLSQTGPHDDEGLGYSDGLKACAKMIRRALLATEPAGGGEKALIAEIAKSEACMGDDGVICEGPCPCKDKAAIASQHGGGDA